MTEVPEEVVTVVVSPVGLTVLTVARRDLLNCLEEIAAGFSMPAPALVSSGCIQVFTSAPVKLGVRDAHVECPS